MRASSTARLPCRPRKTAPRAFAVLQTLMQGCTTMSDVGELNGGHRSGRDVNLVPVDRKVPIRDRRADLHYEKAIHARAARAAAADGSRGPSRHLAGTSALGLLPAAFPMHRITTF